MGEEKEREGGREGGREDIEKGGGRKGERQCNIMRVVHNLGSCGSQFINAPQDKQIHTALPVHVNYSKTC